MRKALATSLLAAYPFAMNSLRKAPTKATDLRAPAPTSVGTKKFERYLEIIIAVFGLLYALQTADALSAQWTSSAGPLGATVIVFAVSSVVVGVTPCFVAVKTSFFFRAALALFVIAILIWPFAIRSAVPASPMPWLVAMWPCEAAYLVVLRTRLWVTSLVSAAVLLYIGTVLLVFGHLALGDVFSSWFFMVAASAVLVLVVQSVRVGVARADAAQGASLSEYGRSRLDDATEAERIRSDALVHDSVLTTFHAAAGARTPETEGLSRRMAANALRVLSHVTRAADMGPGLPFRLAVSDAGEQLEPLLTHFDVRSGPAEDVMLPMAVNEAIIGALVQAMTNSLQHAGQVTRRRIELHPLGNDGIRIVVADDGAGFHVPDALASAHGLRTSVVDRMRLVEGRADVRSTPGGGTTVTLSWGSDVISGTEPLADEALGVVRA